MVELIALVLIIMSQFMEQECIDLGVRKFYVNTEVRNSYLESP
jgi:hypothetical protein